MCLINFSACLILFESSAFYFDSIFLPANTTSSISGKNGTGKRMFLQSKSPGSGRQSPPQWLPRRKHVGVTGPASVSPTSNSAIHHIPSFPLTYPHFPQDLRFYLFLSLSWWTLTIWVLRRDSDQLLVFSGERGNIQKSHNFTHLFNQEHSLPFKF